MKSRLTPSLFDDGTKAGGAASVASPPQGKDGGWGLPAIPISSHLGWMSAGLLYACWHRFSRGWLILGLSETLVKSPKGLMAQGLRYISGVLLHCG